MRKIAAFFISGMVLAGAAHALESKRCGITTDELNAAMAAEHQSAIVEGNRMALTFNDRGIAVDSPRLANIWTSDSQGSGYNIESDKPLGEQATRYCVRAKYVGAKFNDWTKPGVPNFALTDPVSEEEMKRFCASGLNRDLACGVANVMLNNGDRLGEDRVMLAADTIDIEGHVGKKMIVTARAKDGGGATYAVGSNGVALELFMADKMTFTPKGEAIINSKN